jgi:nucleotide sugar dehydrogenase
MRGLVSCKEGRIPDTRTQKEVDRIRDLCIAARKKGQSIVVVQGLGFVGAVNAAVVATSGILDSPQFFVIGVDLPISPMLGRIASINSGVSPFTATDPEVMDIFEEAVNVRKNLSATWVEEAYEEADVVLVDINLDVIKHEVGNAGNFSLAIEAFRKAIATLGERIKPECLVIVETTVPPGTVEAIVRPAIEAGFQRRGIDSKEYPPLVAHAYERVMPGSDYVKSIRNMWRTYSGVSDTAKSRAREFLEAITETNEFPLTCLERPCGSELAKVLENSYRAINIALIHEWTLLAEAMGVNLWEVVESIRVRKGTHDNMMFPGFGVGGYCLTKDSLLAQWAADELFPDAANLTFALQAIDVNDLMPIHTCELLYDGVGGDLADKKVTILGASYRQDVDDTRNSPSLIAYEWFTDHGAEVAVHDPLATKFVDSPAVKIEKDIDAALRRAHGIIFAVGHAEYRQASIDNLTAVVDQNAIFVDANNILTDDKIRQLKRSGFQVAGVGKGHISGL